MKNYYVIINGQRKGPYPEAKVRAALKSGKLSDEAEIYDAATGDIVLAFDIMEGGEQPAQPLQQGVNYGRAQDNADPGQKRGRGSMYTQGAMQHATQWNQQGGGYAPYGYQQGPPPRASGTNPGATAFFVAWLCAPVGFFFALNALKRCKEEGYSTGWAWAAIVMSSLGLLATVIRLLALAAE